MEVFMWNQYVSLVDGCKLITLAVLIIVDLVLGIVVSLKQGTFHFDQVSDYLNTTVLAYVAGYFLVGFVALVHTEFSNIVIAAWGILDLALLAGIWGKLGKLGLPTPKIISS